LQEIKAGHIAAVDISTAEAAQASAEQRPRRCRTREGAPAKALHSHARRGHQAFEPALALAGDKAKGKEIYTQRCATCPASAARANALALIWRAFVTGGKERSSRIHRPESRGRARSSPRTLWK